jgi:hypothetical protein
VVETDLFSTLKRSEIVLNSLKIRAARKVFRFANRILNKFGVLLSVPEVIHGSPRFSGATLWARRLNGLKFYLDKTRGVEGVIVEGGVHWGYGILIEWTLTSDQNAFIIGFDSFAGHSSPDSKDFSGNAYSPLDDCFKTSPSDVWKTLEYGTGLPEHILRTRVKLIDGWVQETMPVFKKEAGRDGTKIRFVHADTDLYEPMKVILVNTWDALSTGGIILVGHLNDPELMGKTFAVLEFLAELPKNSYRLSECEFIHNGMVKVIDSYIEKL